MSDTEQETIPVGGGLEGRARDSGATGMDALVRLMLQREEQMGRREQQMERERAEMQERLERLMTVVERSSGGSRGFVTETETTRGPADQPKLVRLTESDDIEIYLTTFERTMQVYEVDPARWAFKLAPQLTGRAQQAYAALPASEIGDYERLKDAILRRYDISEETHRQRFRSARKQEDESYRELVARLKDMEHKWTKECTSLEQMRELIVREQFLDTLPTDLRVRVAERKPKTALEAGELADDYLRARRQPKELKKQPTTGEKRGTSEVKRCHNCGLQGHLASECRRTVRQTHGEPISDSRSHQSQKTLWPQKPKHEKPALRCYNCGRWGHVASKCPHNAMYCATGHRALKQPIADGRERRYETSRCGVVEGRAVTDVLLDTRCSRTVVRKELVPQKKMIDGAAVTIRCAHGDTVLYPLAMVDIEVRGKKMAVEAAVSETLPMSVLLGTDVPELGELLGATSPEEEALVVLTRAQAKRQQEEERIEQLREQQSATRPNSLNIRGGVSEDSVDTGNEPISTQQQEQPQQQQKERLEDTLGTGDQVDSPTTPFLGAEFSEEMFGTSRDRRKLTRSEKRRERQEHARTRNTSLHPLDLTPEEFQKLQQEDPSLKGIREAASGVHVSAAGPGFYKKNGLIYRRWTPPGRDKESMSVEQLVLPRACRQDVLRIAHSVPLAGHLGRDKTTQCLLSTFYWPTLHKDTADFCRRCKECQKAKGSRVEPAPLIPLPILEKPFKKDRNVYCGASSTQLVRNSKQVHTHGM